MTDFNDWTCAVEDYFGIPDNKRYKDKKYDEVERSKELNEVALEFGKQVFSKSLSGAEDFTMNRRGIVPGAPDVQFGMKFKAEGCFSDAGNDLLLNVGGFTGNNQRFEGDERQRQLDAFLMAPRQYN